MEESQRPGASFRNRSWLTPPECCTPGSSPDTPSCGHPCLAGTQFDSQGEEGVCKQLRPREPFLPEVVGTPQIHVARCRRGCLKPTVGVLLHVTQHRSPVRDKLGTCLTS